MYFLDVFATGQWKAVMDVQDPELHRLAEALPGVVMRCKVTSTTKKYLGAFKRWRVWAASHRLMAFPVNEVHLALYLQHLSESKSSKSAVEEAVNCVAWAHSVAGIPSPTATTLVQSTLGGLKRSLARPVNKKSPFTTEMLQAIVEDARKINTLTSIRLAAACLLSFAGFLRCDELVNIRLCDLAIGETHLSIQIPHSKNDQLHQGREVLIARTGTKTCPVAMLEEYMQRSGIHIGSENKLFRAIASGKCEALRESGGLSRGRFRELVKKKLDELGFHAVEFSPHSLRAGGATAAAAAGVPDQLFKKYGRWKSDSAKDGYIEDSLAERLSVTQKLGL